MPREGNDEQPGSSEPVGALGRAYRRVVAREGARQVGQTPAPQSLGRPSPTWLGLAVVSWMLLIIAVIVPFGPFVGATARPYRAPPGLEAASIRYGMWLAAGRIQQFSLSQHRPPRSLNEIGMADLAFIYRATSDGEWQLTGRAAETALILNSAMSRDEFLGDALDRLREGT